jgi:hypothetical protein
MDDKGLKDSVVEGTDRKKTRGEPDGSRASHLNLVDEVLCGCTEFAGFANLRGHSTPPH